MSKKEHEYKMSKLDKHIVSLIKRMCKREDWEPSNEFIADVQLLISICVIRDTVWLKDDNQVYDCIIKNNWDSEKGNHNE